MKVFDCFLFFNELDLLELRLNILDSCVDYFVIVESAITFQGENKEFIFENNRSRFLKFDKKIVYFKLEKYTLNFDDLPYIKEPQNLDENILNSIYKFIDNCPHFDKKKEFWWGNDFYQRECIWRALAVTNPAPADLIIISDVDEIPNPLTIAAIKEYIRPKSILCLRQHEFCYYINYYHNSDWLGTCCFLHSEFSNVSLNSIRFSAKRDEGLAPDIVNNGGWHFTSIGGVAAIKEKIMSWGHKELNTDVTLQGVEYNVRHGFDIFRRPEFGKLRYLPIEHGIFPTFLVDRIDMFKHLCGPEIEKEKFFQWLYHAPYFYFRSKIGSALRRIRVIFSG